MIQGMWRTSSFILIILAYYYSSAPKLLGETHLTQIASVRCVAHAPRTISGTVNDKRLIAIASGAIHKVAGA